MVAAGTTQLFSNPEHFIAVRKGRSIKRSIFVCWDDAKDHLGPNAEFAIFKDIRDAARYAFWKDVPPQEVVANSTSTTTSSTMEVVVEPKCDMEEDGDGDERGRIPVFSLEDLSQDILNYIFTFACSKEIQADYSQWSGSITAFIPSMGLASKSLYKSCISFIQQAPSSLTMVFGGIPIEKMWNSLLFFIRNRAMLGSCNINVLQEPIDRITASVFLKLIKSFDLSCMKKIKIPRIPSRFCDVDASYQWHLAKIGIPLDALDRDDSISEGFFHKELANILPPAKVVSLKEIEIHLDILHFFELRIIEGCFQLERLRLHLYHPYTTRGGGTSIPSEVDFVETIHTLLQHLPVLKVLKITTSLDHFMGLRISSNSLQSILMHESVFSISLQEVNCPLLRNLKVGMHLESSLDSLESCYRTITDLCLHCRTGCADIHRIFEIVEMMPRLKKIDLDIVEVPCTLKLKSPSLEDVTICGIGHEIELSEVNCPMMKKAEFTFDNVDSFNPFALRGSSNFLENLTILCIDGLEDRHIEATAEKLDQLNKIIHQDMPQLKTLDLAFGEIEGTFVLNFGSKMDIRSKIRFGGSGEGSFRPVIECNCNLTNDIVDGINEQYSCDCKKRV